MPSIVPAAIGLGGSIFSGISGKRAAKKQAQQAAEQYAMLKPLLEAQVKGGQQAIQTGNQQIGQGAGYLSGAQTGLQDLKKVWQPLVSGDRSALDAFLADGFFIQRANNTAANKAAYLANHPTY